MTDRGAIEVETLLKVILVLVVVLLILDVVGSLVRFVVGPLSSLVGLVIVILIVLWLYDRL